MVPAEQSPAILLYRRKVSGERHSFFFTAELVTLERTPSSDEEFFRTIKKKLPATENPDRFEVLSSAATPTSRQDQFCVRYLVRALDKGSPASSSQPLAMTMNGIACRHPLWPDGAVDWYYSERAPVGKLDSSLDAERKELLRGIVIEVEPGVQAT